MLHFVVESTFPSYHTCTRIYNTCSEFYLIAQSLCKWKTKNKNIFSDISHSSCDSVWNSAKPLKITISYFYNCYVVNLIRCNCFCIVSSIYIVFYDTYSNAISIFNYMIVGDNVTATNCKSSPIPY